MDKFLPSHEQFLEKYNEFTPEDVFRASRQTFNEGKNNQVQTFNDLGSSINSGFNMGIPKFAGQNSAATSILNFMNGGPVTLKDGSGTVEIQRNGKISIAPNNSSLTGEVSFGPNPSLSIGHNSGLNAGVSMGDNPSFTIGYNSSKRRPQNATGTHEVTEEVSQPVQSESVKRQIADLLLPPANVHQRALGLL